MEQHFASMGGAFTPSPSPLLQGYAHPCMHTHKSSSAPDVNTNHQLLPFQRLYNRKAICDLQLMKGNEGSNFSLRV